MKVFSFVAIFAFLASVECKKTYRVGVFADDRVQDVGRYVSMIEEAGIQNVDLVVLPLPAVSISDESIEDTDFSPQQYDKNIKTLSEAAKRESIYVVAHLYEETYEGPARTNVVLDRNGEVLTSYKKPVVMTTNSTSEIGSFTSNFGVIFGILFEEDLAIHNIGRYKNVNNFIVLGRSSDEAFIGLEPSWAYISKSHFITNSHVFGNKYTEDKKTSKLIVADLHKDGSEFSSVPVSHPSRLNAPLDLSQYTTKPLDVEASLQGYMDTVCHGTFCCGFYLKTSLMGSSKINVNYALSALDGLQTYGDHNLGVQHCAVFAYTGLYEHVLDFGFNQNHTSIKFDRIVVTHNKTNDIPLSLPIVVSTDIISNKQFYFKNKNTKATIEITDVNNISVFGVFGRNYTRDFIEVKHSKSNSISWDLYDYINKENVSEFFDYLWIRIRILLFIVSIYILEMM